PAALISIGKYLPSRMAAITTALYPASDACEERASIDCAREMRGTISSEKAVTPCAARALTAAALAAGCRKPTETAPLRMALTSASEGGCTRRTTSAADRALAWPLTTEAPASL